VELSNCNALEEDLYIDVGSLSGAQSAKQKFHLPPSTEPVQLSGGFDLTLDRLAPITPVSHIADPALASTSLAGHREGRSKADSSFARRTASLAIENDDTSACAPLRSGTSYLLTISPNKPTCYEDIFL